MKEILLSKGKIMLVDDGDFTLLNCHAWSWFKSKNTFYATTDLGNRRRILAHRLILGVKSYELVDHKDGNGLNNCRSNLRICTRFQNSQHAIIRKDNSTGYKGVKKQENRFVARIGSNGKRYYLGYFYNPIDAAKAYDKAALKYHGDFAQLNFPERKS